MITRRTALAGVAASTLVVGCGESTQTSAIAPPAGLAIPMLHAKTFTVTQREGYRIVDLRAAIVVWGEAAEGREQSARMVLAPKTGTPPQLTGDLAGATLVRTPVERIAVNYGQVEAILSVLGIDDRLVAVGGSKSYKDAIRNRTLAGQIGQVGYGWHSPPALDVLVASQPDVFLMAMSDLDHAEQLTRANGLGVPTMPIFMDNEPHYMGKVDYVRLVGMLTGREAEADAFVADVEARVAAIMQAAAAQPRRSLLAAWPAQSGRWMATVRNADAALLRDANAELVAGQPDDPRRDAWTQISSEQLLEAGRSADCWIIGDPHSGPYTDRAFLAQFKAYREQCVYAATGMTKPEHDAYDIWETAVVRPDLYLGDVARMLHPALRTEPSRYLFPDARILS